MTMKFLPSGLGDGLGAGLVWGGLGAGLVAGADLESGPISLWLNPSKYIMDYILFKTVAQ